MLSADLSSRDFQRILLIKLSAMGDVVHTIPLLNKLRQRYPAARIDWLVTPAIAELLATQSGHHQCHRISPPGMVGAVAAGAVCQRGAADRDAARGAIRSGARSAGPIAQRRVCLHLRRSGADRLRQAARGSCGTPHRAKSRTKRAGTPGKARAKEAGSPIPITSTLPTLDIHPVERYLRFGAMLGLDDETADFSFPIPPEASTRIDALLDYYEIAKAKTRRHGAGHQLGNQTMAAATLSPRWRGISWTKNSPWR